MLIAEDINDQKNILDFYHSVPIIILHALKLKSCYVTEFWSLLSETAIFSKRFFVETWNFDQKTRFFDLIFKKLCFSIWKTWFFNWNTDLQEENLFFDRNTRFFNQNTKFFDRNIRFFDRKTRFFYGNTRFFKNMWQMASIATSKK